MKEGYTRISTILAQWNHLAHIPKHILDNKCRIGTNVHEKIALEKEGIFVNLLPDEDGYYQSWIKWKKDLPKNYEIAEVEKRFYDDKLKITGCVDAIVHNDESGKNHLLDIKTSASINKKMWGLQAIFYQKLLQNTAVKCDNFAWFVQLQKDGSKAKEVVIDFDEDLWEVAMSALKTYRYFYG